MSNEFFVVLPSNSCPLVHPDNSASNFTVSWENPLLLDSSSPWKVALTEMSYNFSPRAPNYDFQLRYNYSYSPRKKIGDYVLEWDYDEEKNVMKHLAFTSATATADKYASPLVHVSYNANHRSIVLGTLRQFTITRIDSDAVGGISRDAINLETNWAIATHGLPPLPKNRIENIEIDFDLGVRSAFAHLPFPKFETKEKLMELLKDIGKPCMDYVDYNSEGLVVFHVKKHINRIEFWNGLHHAIGFTQSTINRQEWTDRIEYTAEYVPQINRGVDHMYIYASCCANVRVGDVQVPLLRNFFIEDNEREPFENPFGKTRNFIVRNPMYMPLASNSINSIEINIRDDSGRLIVFDEGAKSSLTLHFRKHD